MNRPDRFGRIRPFGLLRVAARRIERPAVASVVVLALVLLVGACRDAPPISEEYFRTPTPHEAHRHSLRDRGLDTTALGRQWLTEAERALGRPLDVGGAYAETGRFVRPEADAVGYRIRVERGQRLEIRVEGELAHSGDLLVDLFREAPDPPRRYARVRGLQKGVGQMEVEPERSGAYLLRLQPVLFADGRYDLTIRTVSALSFPVAEHDHDAVWSGFGAPREAGRREHHGVDIFAPRGTPALAAAEAVVRRVRETPVGGKVVWLRDRRRNQSLYYAHLDSQTVRQGERVAVGDTVGLIGNTGNARTTPPHLHFGIYARGEGPIDPLPFIRVVSAEPPTLEADADRSGAWSRVRAAGTRLRSRPSLQGDVVTELDPERPFRVVAATGGWYRVRLPDGSEGYVAEGVTEVPDTPQLARGHAPPAADGSSSTPSEGAPTRSGRAADRR